MKAMVLCAGYGTRLGDLTREIPKPMLPVGAQPLLAYILANLAAHGFDQIAINLHFMPELISSYFADGARYGCRLSYVHETELLGTAGSVKNMRRFLADSDPFLMHYGDVLTDQDFTDMLRFHRERRALATLLTHRRSGSNSALDVADDGRIRRFLERPSADESRTIDSPWVFSGVALCDAALLEMIPDCVPCDFPRHVFAPLVDTQRLFAYPLSGARCAIDSPQRLAEARAAAARGTYRIAFPGK